MAESTEKKTVVERASDLPDEVLERLEARQLAAIEALRKLVDRLDDAMPDLVDDPALRKKVIDAIGDYYEQLVTRTNEFVRSVVRGGSGMVPSQARGRTCTSSCAASCAARARRASKKNKTTLSQLLISALVRVPLPDRSSFEANRTAVASTCKLRWSWR